MRAAWTAALVAIFCLAGAPSARGQVAPAPIEPSHTWRDLTTFDLAFPSRWGPSLTGVGLVQVSLGTDRVSIEEGFRVVRPPTWYLHAMGTAGLSLDEDGDGDAGLAASLALGFLGRVDPTPISSAGAVVEGRWGPRGIAPAIRVELLDNVGAQIGWIFVAEEDGDDGLFVSVDAMRGLWTFLCLWPGAR